MQVSWINPEDVASLAESLRAPARRKPAPVDEPGLSLLEEQDMAALTEALESFNIEPPQPAVTEAPLPPAAEISLPASAEPRVEEETAPATIAAAPVVEHEGGPDLRALRQRLQEIRERAVDAGLLPTPQTVVFPEAVPVEQIPDGEVSLPAMPRSAPRIRRVAAFAPPPGNVMMRLEAFAAWARGCLGTEELFVVDDRGDLLWGPQDQAGLILSTLMAVNAASRASAWSACGEAHVTHQVLPSGMLMTIIPCATRLGMIQVAVAAAETLSPEETDWVRDALVAALDAEESEAA